MNGDTYSSRGALFPTSAVKECANNGLKIRGGGPETTQYASLTRFISNDANSS